MRQLLLVLPLVAFASAGRADTVTLRADVWCPYNCEPKTDAPGYMIEIAKAALEPAGHQVEYGTLNWARAITETRDGKFTGIVGAAKNDAPDFVFPANVLGVSRNCFFTKPDSTWTYTNVEALKSSTIGVAKDYAYEDSIDAYVKENAKDPKRIDFVSGDNPLELNIKKVTAGRIAAFLEDESVLRSHLFRAKLPESTVRNAGCVKEANLYIAFGPKGAKSAELAKLLSDKVEQMRKDGSLKTLLTKYGLNDWAK